MRAEGMLHGDVEELLALYLHQCSVQVTCAQLAVMGATLANVDVCHEIATQLGVHIFAAADEDALLGPATPASER
jgi:glutaminase